MEPQCVECGQYKSRCACPIQLEFTPSPEYNKYLQTLFDNKRQAASELLVAADLCEENGFSRAAQILREGSECHLI